QSLVLMPKTGLGHGNWEVLVAAIFHYKSESGKGLNMVRVTDRPASLSGGNTPSMRHLLHEPTGVEHALCLEISGNLVTKWPQLIRLLRSNPNLTMLRLTGIGKSDQAGDSGLACALRAHALLELHIYSDCVIDAN